MMEAGFTRVSRTISLMLIVVFFCPFAYGKVIHVDDDGHADFDNIQAAIDDANDSDTILVAPGTYIGEGNRDIDFKGKAITVRSTDPNDLEIVKETVIDCQGSEEDAHRGFQFISGEGRDSVLAGFKIINGIGSEIESSNRSMGGAVLCLDSSPTIFGCVIDRNFAGSDGWGGGIYCLNSSAAITRCIIQYNEAYAGGGIFCIGGSVVIDQCMLSSNISRSDWDYTYGGCGGGICCFNSSAVITKCIVQYNTTSRKGGGIYCDGGSVVIDQCILNSNISRGGGGIYFGRGIGSVLNSLISSNQTRGNGGGILYYDRAAEVTLNNCTIVRNLASSGLSGGIASLGSFGSEKPIILTNCILWGNRLSGKCEFSTQVYKYATKILSYCCVQGWTPERGGDGNFGDDPLLTPDFHLQADSPCINNGILNGSFTQSRVDIDGESRDLGEQADIGCDEYIDLDNDGLADFWELTHFETTVNVEAKQNPDEDPWTNIQEYNQSSNPHCPPATFYVDVLDGDDFWDGLSPVWDGQHGPKETIQAAINQTSFYEHDIILLAPGNYTGDGNRDIDFVGKVITVKSEDGPDTCIIDCQGSQDEPHRGFYFHSDEDTNSIVQGVTIINGYTARGGGIICENASPQILDCLIADNTASEKGGAVQCDYSNPIISHCIIRNNAAETGGGVGTGIEHSSTSSLLTMTNCFITGNWAEGSGGGIHCSGEIALINCTIFGNRAKSYYGGGIYLGVGKISNSILYGNMAGRTGNEIGQGPHGAGGCRPDLVKITHSVVGSGPNAIDIPRCYSGKWLYADPLFANPGYWNANSTPDDHNDDFWIDGDYHLKSQAGRWDPVSESWVVDDVTSSCIDAGDPNSPIGDEPFPNSGIINMGAYGGTSQASLSLSTAVANGVIIDQQLNAAGQGYTVVRFYGSYYEMGYAHGDLLADYVVRSVEETKELFGGLYTGMRVAMADSVWMPAEIEQEFDGMVDALAERHPAAGIDKLDLKTFNGLGDLLYACRSHTCWGRYVAAPIKTLSTRRLDFPTPIGSLNHHVLFVYIPDDGSARWVNLGFPGMVTAAQGVNEFGTLVSLHDYNSWGADLSFGRMPRIIACRYALTYVPSSDLSMQLSDVFAELQKYEIMTGTFLNYYAPEGHGGVMTCNPNRTGPDFYNLRTPQNVWHHGEAMITTNQWTNGNYTPSDEDFGADVYYNDETPKTHESHWSLVDPVDAQDGLQRLSVAYRGKRDMTIWADGRIDGIGRTPRLEYEWSELFGPYGDDYEYEQDEATGLAELAESLVLSAK